MGGHLCLSASLAARGAPSAAGCPFLCVQLVLALRLGAVGQREGPPFPRLDGLWGDRQDCHGEERGPAYILPQGPLPKRVD